MVVVICFLGGWGRVFGLKLQSVGEFYKIFANTTKTLIFTAPGFFGPPLHFYALIEYANTLQKGFFLYPPRRLGWNFCVTLDKICCLDNLRTFSRRWSDNVTTV